MVEVLRFFETYEHAMYFILGLGGLVYGARFWLAWQEARGAVFGLEQISAQRKLNREAIAIFFIAVMGFVVFALVTFVAPVVAPEVVLPLPSTDLTEDRNGEGDTSQENNPSDVLATATALPTVEIITEGCVPGSVEITAPEPGEAVSGVVTVTGTADIPNFGFYKFEVARSQEELWLTVLAGRTVVVDGELVSNWDTSLIAPGEYVVQLVVTDNNGEAQPPCRVPVRIGAAP